MAKIKKKIKTIKIDKESICAKGFIAFEYERLVGKVDRVINTCYQSESFIGTGFSPPAPPLLGPRSSHVRTADVA
jgi:hypothetical protein